MTFIRKYLAQIISISIVFTSIPNPSRCSYYIAPPGSADSISFFQNKLNTDEESQAEQIKRFIGSPEGQGKAKPVRLFEKDTGPVQRERRVLTGKGSLEKKKVTLLRKIGSGYATEVFKGYCEGKLIVEKLTGTARKHHGLRGLGSRIMSLTFLTFRQAPFSYRANFYASMTNHYGSLIIETASMLEFGKSIIPKLMYTAYENGFITAYEFIEGRNIRPGTGLLPGNEEKILKENLRKYYAFLINLGFWGIARQCDPKNINSPGNVYILNGEGNNMMLVDVMPGVLGGVVWFVPLEIKYFVLGIITGNFLPFGDAVNLKRLKKYITQFSVLNTSDQIKELLENIRRFEFYLKKWRNSEPMLFRSPFRVLWYLFSKNTMKATTKTTTTAFEYKGIIAKENAQKLREIVDSTQDTAVLRLLRTAIHMHFLKYLLKEFKNLFFGIPDFIKNIFITAVKYLKIIWLIYTNPKYREVKTKRKVRNWIFESEIKDKRITPEEKELLLNELQHRNVLEAIMLYPLWSVAKFIKPPFIGTVSNIVLIYMILTTFNLYLLIPLFLDGIIRALIAIGFTGFKYKILIFWSIFPTIGFVTSIPAQIKYNAPHLANFLMREVLGSKIGTSAPGVDKHSFRAYFYIRFMKIPMILINLFTLPFEVLFHKKQSPAILPTINRPDEFKETTVSI